MHTLRLAIRSKGKRTWIRLTEIALMFYTLGGTRWNVLI